MTHKLWIYILLLLACSEAMLAQSFGRNKVQYEDFEFSIYETKHFSIHYYEEVKKAVPRVADQAEAWYQYQSRLLKHELKRKNPIILYANDADFQQTTVISSLIGEGVGGVTESLKNRIVMPLNGVPEETNHILGHELVHAFQYSLIASIDSLGPGGMNRLPLWLVEGMAEYLSLGNADVQTGIWMRDAVLNEDVPDIKTLTTDPEYFPYRYGHALLAFIAGKWGDQVLPELLTNTAVLGVAGAIETTLGTPVDSLSLRWKEEMMSYYGGQMADRAAYGVEGKVFLCMDKGGGEFNIGPNVSPDGRQIVFFSERDIFTFDLYLADTQTGKILRKLATSRTNAHYNAIRFIESTGAWSPDSKHFAITVFHKGRNDILILDVVSGKIIRRHELTEVGAVFHLSWSPDGRNIAFSGVKDGISGLFLYDIQSQSCEQLTGRQGAAIQPAWSPDGKELVFSSQISENGESRMNITLFNLETGEIRYQKLLKGANHFNPLFAADGNSLFFMSDWLGFSEIYRWNRGANTLFQVTRSKTGVGGITEYAPVFSLSQGTGQLFFSVYEGKEYKIRALQPAELTGSPIDRPLLPYVRGDELPPAERISANQIDFLLDSLPHFNRADTVDLIPYKPRLGLDYISNATIGLGVSTYGVGLAGGVNLRFADMLNERLLYTGIAVNGSLKDLSVQAIYLNQDKRAAKGVVAGHLSFLSVGTRVGYDSISIDGERLRAVRVDQVRFRTIEDQLGLLIHYPLSPIKRLETELGVNRISYSAEQLSDFYVNNLYVGRQRSDLEVPGALTMFSFSQSLVGDRSYAGYTSPLKGSRFRLSVGGHLGSLNLMTILADYRQYYYLKPFSFAARVLHYGRYFEDAESDRLSSLFIGYGNLVRGYGPFTFESLECELNGGNGCPAFDRLSGSKIVVSNFELRYPLVGSARLAPLHSNAIGVTLSAFLDFGLAWWSFDKPELSLKQHSSGRIPVTSSGVSGRVNIGGMMVLEIYYARPYQRPLKGGHFGLVLSPGW